MLCVQDRLTQLSVMKIWILFNTDVLKTRDGFCDFFKDFFVGAGFVLGGEGKGMGGVVNLLNFHFIFQKTWVEPGNPN